MKKNKVSARKWKLQIQMETLELKYRQTNIKNSLDEQ